MNSFIHKKFEQAYLACFDMYNDVLGLLWHCEEPHGPVNYQAKARYRLVCDNYLKDAYFLKSCETHETFKRNLIAGGVLCVCL